MLKILGSLKGLGVILIVATSCAGAHPAAASVRSSMLQIYFIDVEGGQSTLVVTPTGKALLIDTGYAGDGVGFKPGDPAKARDANRIVAAARDAGVRRIDQLLITHFHADHDGGVRELSQLMPIDAFIDHGSPSPQVASHTGVEQLDAFGVYTSVRSGLPHLQPKPGERLPLNGVEVTIVSTAGSTITKPLPHAGSSNKSCSDHFVAARDPYENPRSTGILLQYGKFRFLDVGDLSGEPLFNLVCPNSLIGPVDAYLVAHHGGADVADPAIFAAFRPRVAIMNNGLSKGGSQNTYEELHRVENMDVWQLHKSSSAGPANYPDRRVANLDQTTAFWVKIEARADGSFRVINARTQESVQFGRR